MTEDQKQHDAMRKAWVDGSHAAIENAERLQAIGDHLAGFIHELDGLAPGIPDTDPTEWYETVTPGLGVSPWKIQKRLRAAMSAVYGMAGVYRRSAGELADALRADDMVPFPAEQDGPEF